MAEIRSERDHLFELIEEKKNDINNIEMEIGLIKAEILKFD